MAYSVEAQTYIGANIKTLFKTLDLENQERVFEELSELKKSKEEVKDVLISQTELKNQIVAIMKTDSRLEHTMIESLGSKLMEDGHKLVDSLFGCTPIHDNVFYLYKQAGIKVPINVLLLLYKLRDSQYKV